MCSRYVLKREREFTQSCIKTVLLSIVCLYCRTLLPRSGQLLWPSYTAPTTSLVHPQTFYVSTHCSGDVLTEKVPNSIRLNLTAPDLWCEFNVGADIYIYYNCNHCFQYSDSAAGGSDDWAKGGAGVKYSYTIELRDTGAHGFVLPTNQIEPNCRESWRGLAEFALSLNTNKGGHRG